MHSQLRNIGQRVAILADAVAIAIATALVAGCATPINDARTATEAVKSDAQSVMRRMDQVERLTGAVTRYAGQRLAGDEMTVSVEAQRRPKVLDQSFVYNTPGQMLPELAENVSRRIGMPVRVTQIAPDPFGAAGGAGASAPASPVGVNSGLPAGMMAVEYAGTLAGFLDLVAARTNSYWRESNSSIEFLRVETRSFQVYLPQAAKTVSQSISLGSSGGGSSGGSGGTAGSVSVSSDAKIDAYEALVVAVRGIVNESSSQQSAPSAGGAGAAGAGAQRGTSSGAVVANRPLGMITVTARPPVLDRVAEYIKTINDRFAQNVYIDVRVMRLTMSKDAAMGFSANAVLNDVKGRASLNLTNPPMPTGNVNPSVLSATLRSLDGRNSIELLLQALSTYGSVSEVISGQVLAVNGQPSPFQQASDLGYIASSSTVLVPNVGAQTSLTPGSVRVGFTANFLPLVLGDNRILLDYSLTLSSATITQITSTGASPSVVGLPNVVTQAYQQNVFVRDGESIVLFGFDQERNEHNNSAGITALGAAGSGQRQITVIVMEVYGGRA